MGLAIYQRLKDSKGTGSTIPSKQAGEAHRRPTTPHFISVPPLRRWRPQAALEGLGRRDPSNSRSLKRRRAPLPSMRRQRPHGGRAVTGGDADPHHVARCCRSLLEEKRSAGCTPGTMDDYTHLWKSSSSCSLHKIASSIRSKKNQTHRGIQKRTSSVLKDYMAKLADRRRWAQSWQQTNGAQQDVRRVFHAKRKRGSTSRRS